MELLADPCQGESHSSLQPLTLVDIFLKPILLTDGRIYDLLEPRVYEVEKRPYRWMAIIEVQSRSCEVHFVSKTLVFESAFLRGDFHSYHLDQGQALALIGRERTVEYLRYHPKPERCYDYRMPLLMEYV